MTFGLRHGDLLLRNVASSSTTLIVCGGGGDCYGAGAGSSSSCVYHKSRWNPRHPQFCWRAGLRAGPPLWVLGPLTAPMGSLGAFDHRRYKAALCAVFGGCRHIGGPARSPAPTGGAFSILPTFLIHTRRLQRHRNAAMRNRRRR
jgi:hypothetical protein